MLNQLKEKASIAAMETANITKGKANEVRIIASEATKKAQDITKRSTDVIQSKSILLSEKTRSILVKNNIQNKTDQLNDELDLESGTTLISSTSMLKGGGERKDISNNSQDDSLFDELNNQCKLTKKQRLYGAISCYLLGGICSIFSTLALFGGSRHISKFAFFYTVGNILSISSSMFLIGPRKQIKVMCLPIRRVACIIWFIAMLLTIIVAFTHPKAALFIFLLIFIQYSAMLWYGASYIPFGREILMKCLKKLISKASEI